MAVSNNTYSKVGSTQRICIVGIGNTLRGDDGAGDLVCRFMDEKRFPGVSVISRQQLDIGITEELVQYDAVIFVDASVKEETISFNQVSLQDHQSRNLSHHIDASVLAALAKTLYHAHTRFYMCAIGGSDFEIGPDLSETALKNVNASVSFLEKWILSGI
jgi:hydrogenase maturation protease